MTKIAQTTFEIYHEVDGTVTVKGVYYGSRARDFVPVRRRFETIIHHMLDHHVLDALEDPQIYEYNDAWIYCMRLYPKINNNRLDHLIDWYQEIAQKDFLTPEQYLST